MAVLYTDQYVDSQLEQNVTELKRIVGGRDATFNCTNLSIDERFDTVEHWKVRHHYYHCHRYLVEMYCCIRA